MKKEIRTEITINANKENVWKALLDFDKHKEWNPFVTSISGNSKKGGKLKITIQPPNSKTMSFTPIVQECVEYYKFSWKGSLMIPGLFDGTHSFELVEEPNNKTKLIHSEQFSGILTFMLDLENTKKGFDMMNNALKRHIESKPID